MVEDVRARMLGGETGAVEELADGGVSCAWRGGMAEQERRGDLLRPESKVGAPQLPSFFKQSERFELV